jgi:uroporphyrin-III C-methyltransferase / precorrin-2 dehydrogenase / sirohydrochlorin ferrochelatase
LPVLVSLAGRPVILVGDGEAAAAKRRLLERAGATVVDDHPDARLAIVAIEDEAGAQRTVAELRGRGLLVNAVDRPALCDFTLPAVVDRAPVLVAVMTGGVSAGLAAALRQRLEALLPASLGRLATALAVARPALRARFPDAGERRRAIGSALAGALDPLEADAADRVEAVLLADGPNAVGDGTEVRLVSDDPDDLTLRQARALALAERVLHRPEVPAALLARARADAPRLPCAERPARLGAGDVWVEQAR